MLMFQTRAYLPLLPFKVCMGDKILIHFSALVSYPQEDLRRDASGHQLAALTNPSTTSTTIMSRTPTTTTRTASVMSVWGSGTGDVGSCSHNVIHCSGNLLHSCGFNNLGVGVKRSPSLIHGHHSPIVSPALLRLNVTIMVQ